MVNATSAIARDYATDKQKGQLSGLQYLERIAFGVWELAETLLEQKREELEHIYGSDEYLKIIAKYEILENIARKNHDEREGAVANYEREIIATNPAALKMEMSLD